MAKMIFVNLPVSDLARAMDVAAATAPQSAMCDA